MRRVAITAVLTIGLLAGTAAAANVPPRISATGKILALSANTITIDSRHDLKCRFVTIRPRLLGYRLGTNARITCVKGILKAIMPVTPKGVPITPVTPATTPGTSTPPTATGPPTTVTLLPPPGMP